MIAATTPVWRLLAGLAPGLSRGVTVLLLALLSIYRRVLSPLFTHGLGAGCRFHPTCSRYATRAIAMHGPLGGGWLLLHRMARCHPLSPGGIDDVPLPQKRTR